MNYLNILFQMMISEKGTSCRPLIESTQISFVLIRVISPETVEKGLFDSHIY